MDRHELRDYVSWHDGYRDPSSGLSARLRTIQQAILEWYDATPGPVRVLSACAGQGDDILGVLAEHPELVGRTTGALLELNATNAGIARERIAALGATLEVVECDAGTADSYVGRVPANLVLLCGIMGNISADDIHALIAAAPQFCAPAALVIWTRGSQEPDLAPEIRRWFAEAGFVEQAFSGDVGDGKRVGIVRYAGEPRPLVPGARLFEFFR